jgi:hypothetical protein
MLPLLLRADDQVDQRLQNLSEQELIALQVAIRDALDRRHTTAESQPTPPTPVHADFTTEWWPPD